MTVHKAKGLEFPVVILADPTCPAARDTPSRHVDPSRRLWVEPLCGSAPIELLEAADEELQRDRAEAIRVVLRDNLDENGASIWMRRGGRWERQLTMVVVLARLRLTRSVN